MGGNRNGRTNPQQGENNSNFQDEIANGRVPGSAGKDYPVNSLAALRKKFPGLGLAPDELIVPGYPLGNLPRRNKGNRNSGGNRNGNRTNGGNRNGGNRRTKIRIGQHLLQPQNLTAQEVLYRNVFDFVRQTNLVRNFRLVSLTVETNAQIDQCKGI